MTRSTGKRLAPFLAIPLLLASAIDPVTGQDPPASVEKPTEPPTAAPTEETLRAALNEKLNRRVEAHFDNIPLRDSVGYIAAQIQVDAIFDTNSIEEEGLNIDAPITLHIQHTPAAARQVLHEILDPHGLAIINDNGLLKVATKTLAEETCYVRVYDMQAILNHALARGEFRNHLKDNQHLAGEHPSRDSELKTTALIAFAEVIRRTTSGPWLEYDGSGGEVSYMENQLIIMQNDKCHREIASILRQWRENQLIRPTEPLPREANRSASRPMSEQAWAPTAPTVEAARNLLNEKLDRQVTARFNNVPLRDAVEVVANTIEADLILDEKSIEEEGLDTNIPVSLHIEESAISGRQALRHLLQPNGLAYINEDGLLQIVSAARADEALYTKIYEIRDLLESEGFSEELKWRRQKMRTNPTDDSGPSDTQENEELPARTFERFLQNATSGPWLYRDAIGGESNFFSKQLIVRQNEENHQQIETLLQQLRENLARDDGMPQKKPSDARPAHEADRPRSAARAAPPVNALRAALDEKLDRQVNVSIESTSVPEFVEYIANTIDTNVIIDDQSIQEEGLSLDIPISLHLKRTPVSAWRALRLGLQPHGLAPINADGVLTIMSETTAQETLHTRVYDMQAILNHALTTGEFRNYLKNNQHLAGAHPSRDSELKTTALIAFAEVIQQTTSGPWLDIEGTGGTISYMDDQLVVMQNDKCHREIASILRQWRENQLNRNTSPTPPAPAATLPPSQEILEQQK